MKPKKKSRQMSIKSRGFTEIEEAVAQVLDADYGDPSDAESALDSLASALHKHILVGELDVFWNSVPDIYEVVSEIDDKFGLSTALLDAAAELRNFAADSYREEYEEEEIEEVASAAGVFCRCLNQFLSRATIV